MKKNAVMRWKWEIILISKDNVDEDEEKTTFELGCIGLLQQEREDERTKIKL